MNTRSLRFRLIVWYAGVLATCSVVLGLAAYVALRDYLVGALKSTQLRRARQVAQLVISQGKGDVSGTGAEVETRYAPGANERFVRISNRKGEVIYCSSAPVNLSFDPVTFPSPTWPIKAESSGRLPLPEGREMLLTRRVAEVAGGPSYLVETGAPMDEVQDDLNQWLMFLLAGLPVVLLISVAGGYFLIKRALAPVDRITKKAEDIGSHNLSERLPVPQTEDELERLSAALNRMIERLDQAFQYSRRFVADASHELRTPLTVLRGELEELASEERLPGELKDRVGSSLEEVERLVNIVEGLFAISRLDAGEAQAEWVKFDLAKLAASTADQMSLLGEDKNIDLTCAVDKPVWIEGDRARMKQVVVNLLDNAIKYTPPGGSVRLTVESRNNRAVMEVSDNGIGIPAEALPRVFERFFRVDEARSRGDGGAGLGLSIVNSICTAHHGQVEAASERGSGSRFKVELPLATIPPTNGH